MGKNSWNEIRSRQVLCDCRVTCCSHHGRDASSTRVRHQVSRNHHVKHRTGLESNGFCSGSQGKKCYNGSHPNRIQQKPLLRLTFTNSLFGICLNTECKSLFTTPNQFNSLKGHSSSLSGLHSGCRGTLPRRH